MDHSAADLSGGEAARHLGNHHDTGGSSNGPTSEAAAGGVGGSGHGHGGFVRERHDGESMDMDELGRERMRRKHSSGGAVMDVPALDEFICPLSGDVMEEPVRIASGHSFERASIQNYFQEGHTTCPVTGQELPNQDLQPNNELAKSIVEWRSRNVALRIQTARPKLASAKEEDVEAGLLDLFQLCDERAGNRQLLAALEGEDAIIPSLVGLLKSPSRNLRRKTLATLANLSSGNDQIKELVVQAGTIPVAVRSLARDVGESRQAVALLLELSKSAVVCEEIGRTQGSILLLVTMLNSDNPKAARDAAAVLEQLASNDRNVVQMAEANHFKPLTERLTSASDMTRIVMASALSRMSLTDQSKQKLVEEGAIAPLVSMVSTGKLEAKAAALGALQNLSTLPSNRGELMRGGVIPPLLTLLFSVTSVVMSLKESAAAILANISLAGADASLAARIGTADVGGAASLESEETIFQLLSLLNLAGSNIQANLLRALLGMAAVPEASTVRTRMIVGGAIDVLIPFLDAEGNATTRPLAAKVLTELSRDAEAAKKVADSLVEGQGAPLKAVVAMLADKDHMENRAAAASLIAALPQKDDRLNGVLMQANVVDTLVEMLSVKMGMGSNAAAVRDSVQEGAANALARFTLPSNVKQQQAIAEMGAITRLVTLLTTGNMGAKRGAALCLGNFSESTPTLSVGAAKPKKGGGCCFKAPEEPKCVIHGGPCSVRASFCLLEAEAIEPLVGAMVEKEALTSEAALVALSTLMTDSCRWEESVKIIHGAGGFTRVVQQLSEGTERAKEKGVWMLEKLFRLEEYKFEYATKAQGALIEITQKGSNETKPVAAKILSHLELLHQQSSYF